MMRGDSDEKKLRIGSFAAHSTRGIIRHQGIRRRAMLAVVAVALVMLVAGTTFLRDLLDPKEHSARYILFWLACAWFTACALLLALFDVLSVRAEGRAAKRLLREQAAPRQRADESTGDDAS